jgi:WhiB family redox-sensing transcriptional regulator
MLTALSPTPIRLILIRNQPPPPTTLKWLSPGPRKRTGATRVPLATGVWVVPNKSWLPVSALDIGELVPVPDVTPSYNRNRRPDDWTERGLCSQLPTTQSDNLFFGIERREAPGRLAAAVNKARAICAQCPVAAACLTNALVRDERYGVWGGTSGRQREKMRLRLLAGATINELVYEVLPSIPPKPAVNLEAAYARRALTA